MKYGMNKFIAQCIGYTDYNPNTYSMLVSLLI